MSDRDSLRDLASHLEGMRAGLQEFESGERAAWPDAGQRRSVLLDRYDAGLVRAAELLGLPVPDPPAGSGRRLDDADRRSLEDGLRTAGIEL